MNQCAAFLPRRLMQPIISHDKLPVGLRNEHVGCQVQGVQAAKGVPAAMLSEQPLCFLRYHLSERLHLESIKSLHESVKRLLQLLCVQHLLSKLPVHRTDKLHAGQL